MKAALVYQAGIANVFQVDQLTCSPKGRNAIRLMQHAFQPCEYFLEGLRAAGCEVFIFGCNRAGDITNATWTEKLEDCPFSDKFGESSTA